MIPRVKTARQSEEIGNPPNQKANNSLRAFLRDSEGMSKTMKSLAKKCLSEQVRVKNAIFAKFNISEVL